MTIDMGADKNMDLLNNATGRSVGSSCKSNLTVFSTPDDGFTPGYSGGIAPTSVLVHSRVAGYRLISGAPTTFGTVRLAANLANMPEIMAVHVAPPLPELMIAWRDDLARVFAQAARQQKPLILAGDFNATRFCGCLDSAESRLWASVGQQCSGLGRFRGVGKGPGRIVQGPCRPAC